MGRYKLLGIVIALMFILPSFSLVAAAPPVLSTIQAGSLEIIAPTWVNLKINQPMDFYWHVLNTTTLLKNTSVSCAFHLYKVDNKGQHIYVDNAVTKMEAGRDFEVSIPSNNFSTIGEYCKLVECNTSTQTGALERCFSITDTGNTSADSNIVLMILLFAVAYGILIIGISTKSITGTMLGGFATMAVGIFSINLGFGGVRNEMTYIISILTIAIGGFWAAKAGLEQIQENL